MQTKVLSLFGYISQSTIPGLYVKSMLSFIFKTAKPSSKVAAAFCIAPRNPYHHQYNTISHVVLPVLWILPILVDVQWCLTAVLICSFLRTCDIDFLMLICHLSTFFDKVSGQIYCHFVKKIESFVFLLLSLTCSLCILDIGSA